MISMSIKLVISGNTLEFNLSVLSSYFIHVTIFSQSERTVIWIFDGFHVIGFVSRGTYSVLICLFVCLSVSIGYYVSTTTLNFGLILLSIQDFDPLTSVMGHGHLEVNCQDMLCKFSQHTNKFPLNILHQFWHVGVT